MGSRKSAPAPIIIQKDRSTSYSSSSQQSARSLDSIESASTESASTLSPGGIPRRNMNVYTHCGRHTNQFLFGGRSFTDMARSVFRRE